MRTVRPDKGVFKQKGSDVWQHRIYVPADVRQLYDGKDALPARSLGTRDFAEANRLARHRTAEHENEFAAKRQSRATGSPVTQARSALLADTIGRLASQHAGKLLDDDFARRVEIGVGQDNYARRCSVSRP